MSSTGDSPSRHFVRSKSAFEQYEAIDSDHDYLGNDQQEHQRFLSMVEPRQRRALHFGDNVSPDRYSEPGYRQSNRISRTRSVNFDNQRPLDRKKEQINSMFGFIPFKGSISKRELSERSQEVKGLYVPFGSMSASQLQPATRQVSFGNVLYAILLGWWVALIYYLVAMLCFISIICIPFGKLCVSLGTYYLWPFGKYIERIHDQTKFLDQLATNKVFEYESDRLKRDYQKRNQASPTLEDHSILHPTLVVSTNQDTNTTYTVQLDTNASTSTSRSVLYSDKSVPIYKKIYQITSQIVFFIFMAPPLIFSHLACAFISWYGVITIPIAKVHFEGLKLLFRDVRSLRVSDRFPPSPGSDIQLCTYQAINIYYYKYSIFGANVILFNLLFTVPTAIIMGFAGEAFLEKMAILIFLICLLSNVPLSYYIGKSVSTISAQTSFAVGAFLNAAFGSVIELLLYFLSLAKGLEDLVQQAVTGSLIANMLLLPGIAMVFGGLKYKQQFFNRTAAGVSSTLLLIALVGAFMPTLFYQIYGSYELNCNRCYNSTSLTNSNGTLSCTGCAYVEKYIYDDPIYIHKARPLMYACAAILPIAYVVGLIFTLKTHAYLYENNPSDNQEESDDDVEDPPKEQSNTYQQDAADNSTENPVVEKKKKHSSSNSKESHAAEWSITKSIVILLISTGLYAAVAEVMTRAITPALKLTGISEQFAGLTIIGALGNTAEFINAIQFALQNNITLSMEIGMVSAIQIALLQIPILVGFSALIFQNDPQKTFTLIFPQLDLFAIIFAVIILNYITIDGNTNYFAGASLIIVYLLSVAAFFFTYW